MAVFDLQVVAVAPEFRPGLGLIARDVHRLAVPVALVEVSAASGHLRKERRRNNVVDRAVSRPFDGLGASAQVNPAEPVVAPEHAPQLGTPLHEPTSVVTADPVPYRRLDTPQAVCHQLPESRQPHAQGVLAGEMSATQPYAAATEASRASCASASLCGRAL